MANLPPRIFVPVIGALLLLLDSGSLHQASLFWKNTSWEGEEARRVEGEIFRFPLGERDLPGEDEASEWIFSSEGREFPYFPSTRALEESGEIRGFALTPKNVRFKDPEFRINGNEEQEFTLSHHRLGSFLRFLLRALGAVLLLGSVLHLLLERGRSIRDELLPLPEGESGSGDPVLRIVDGLLVGYLVLTSMVLLIGYALSTVGRFGEQKAWAAGLGLGTILGTALVLRFVSPDRRKRWRRVPVDAFRRVRSEAVVEWQSSPIRCSLALVLLVGLLLAGVMQVLAALLLAPTNYDSLTYILPRIANYLQRGSVSFFEGNFIAMTVHNKNVAVLQSFAFLAGGRNENAISVVSLVASGAAMLATFGLARQLCGRLLPSLGAMAVMGLAANFLMISVTPQLDMAVTGFFAVGLFFLLRWGLSPSCGMFPAFLAGISLCIAVGCKATGILLGGAFSIVAIGCLCNRVHQGRKVNKGIGALAGGGLLGLLLFVLPAGYLENWQRYGDVMGPEGWREAHVLAEETLGGWMKEGGRNAGRYFIHHVGLDGFPYQQEWISLQAGIRAPMVGGLEAIGIELQEMGSARQPFRPSEYWVANEDLSFAGPGFFLLVVPGVILALWRLRRKTLILALLFSAIAYFFAQSFSSRYDPWRGRTFVNLLPVLAPMCAILFCGPGVSAGKRNWRSLKLGLLSLACLITLYAGINAAYFRYSSPLFSRQGTIAFEGCLFAGERDRLWQVFRTNPTFLARARALESALPASAELVVDVRPDGHYSLFGPRLARPVRYREEFGEIPENAFFLFSESSAERPQPSDRRIGPVDSDAPEAELWYLRAPAGSIESADGDPTQSFPR